MRGNKVLHGSCTRSTIDYFTQTSQTSYVHSLVPACLRHGLPHQLKHAIQAEHEKRTKCLELAWLACVGKNAPSIALSEAVHTAHRPGLSWTVHWFPLEGSNHDIPLVEYVSHGRRLRQTFHGRCKTFPGQIIVVISNGSPDCAMLP